MYKTLIYEKKDLKDIKIGMRVKFDSYEAVVRVIRNHSEIGWEIMDEDFAGHNLDGSLTEHNGWWVWSKRIEPILQDWDL